MTLEQHSDGAQRTPNSVDGTAALVLAESLLHVLVERSVLTLEDAMSAVRTAIIVAQDEGFEGSRSKLNAAEPADPLIRILDSLAVDVGMIPPRAGSGPYPPLHAVD